MPTFAAMSRPSSASLFPPLVNAVVQALQAIFMEGRYADKVIEQALRADRRRGARDRAFIAGHTYEVVRWYRLLCAALGEEPGTEAGWYRLFGAHWVLQGGSLPPWREFAGLDAAQIRAQRDEALTRRALAASIPDWLDELGQSELGEGWAPALAALNQPAPLVVRVNTLLTDKAAAAAALAQAGAVVRELPGAALLLEERMNLFQSDVFQRGWVEVQDYSSQQVALFSDVEPGMRVVDACAGAGGKTLHLAALMENKGQLIALDTEDWKLQELRRRARRAGVHVAETRLIDTAKVVKRLHGQADRVLLDAPCSGIGVLRRNPDAKWKLSADFIARITDLQADILGRYSRMCKPGGKLIYATCSILPGENERQVEAFLSGEAGQGFELEAMQTLLPQDEGFDGFFMARMRQKE